MVVENVERHLSEGQIAAGRGPAGRPRTGRADHRHDHHPGRGLCPHRPPGRAHRLALPRIRLHPGRGGDHLRRRGPDPVADDVGQAAQAGDRRARPGRPDRPRLQPAAQTPMAAGWTPPLRPGRRSIRSGSSSACSASPCSSCRPRNWRPTEDQGVIFGIVDAAANSTLDQTSRLYRRGQQGLSERAGNRLHLPDHPAHLRFQRHGGQALGPAEADRLCRSCPRCSRSSRPSPASGSSR